MISKQDYKEAYVWIWLPKENEPVVAGKLESDGKNISFNYGKSYLERLEAISIYEPELPLQSGILPLPNGLQMPSSIRDAAPDAWGRRVIINRKMGIKGIDTDTDILDEMTYLLESSSDRIGALDFQHSPKEYIPRFIQNASLEELLESAKRVESGIPLSPDLDQALFHGSSIGGARPKALIEDNDSKYIAKFSATHDTYSVVKAEYIAMRLAALCGLSVAPVKLVQASSKDVLLIERFDRYKTESGWGRKSMVSALTLFGLSEMTARYASYEDFAEIIRMRFKEPKHTLKELFSRLVFNILSGNNDDHARNHAAFWDGKDLTLTPAYDICPQARTGNVSSQAMKIIGNNGYSQLKTCLMVAHHFLLSDKEAIEIFDNFQNIIRDNWDDVCDEAKLTQVDKSLFLGRQFLNQFSLEY